MFWWDTTIQSRFTGICPLGVRVVSVVCPWHTHSLILALSLSPPAVCFAAHVTECAIRSANLKLLTRWMLLSPCRAVRSSEATCTSTSGGAVSFLSLSFSHPSQPPEIRAMTQKNGRFRPESPSITPWKNLEISGEIKLWFSCLEMS